MAFARLTVAMLTCLITCRGCRLSSTVQLHQNVSCPDTYDWSLQKEIPVHECMMQCMQRNCHLVSYNQPDGICLISDRPCVVLEPRPGFVSQALRTSPASECVQWVKFVSASDYPARLVEILSVRVTVAIVKFLHGGDLLPGKLEKSANQQVVSVYSRREFGFDHPTSAVEFLTVHPMCSLIWLPYSATTPGPLPYGAVIAGRKQDGTPLYPARSFFALPQTQEYTAGYYDPQTREAYFGLFGTRVLREIDILCVVWIHVTPRHTRYEWWLQFHLFASIWLTQEDEYKKECVMDESLRGTVR